MELCGAGIDVRGGAALCFLEAARGFGHLWSDIDFDFARLLRGRFPEPVDRVRLCPKPIRGSCKSGFPHRLLLKPVSTAWLALVPMFAGGAAAFLALLLWLKLVLHPLDLFTGLDPFWLGAVTLSFFWWMQALSWSTPLLPGRVFIVLTVSVIHLAIGLMPMPESPLPVSAVWRCLILTVMLPVRRARGRDRAKIDAPWNLGKSLALRQIMERMETRARADCTQEVWLRVPGAILARMAKTRGLLPALHVGRRDSRSHLSPSFISSPEKIRRSHERGQ